jgi:HlyD family secretion protein
MNNFISPVKLGVRAHRVERKKPMKKRTWISIVQMMILSSLFISACSGTAPKSSEPTSTPDAEGVQPVVSATGVVIPVQWSTLSMKTAGIVEAVLVEEAQQVVPGQVLVRLQGQDSLRSAVAEAESQVLAAQQALDNLNEGHPSTLAQAQLRLAQAEKALKKAKDQRTGKNYKRANPDLIAVAKANYLMAKDEFKQAEESWSYFAGKDEEDINRAFALSQYENARKKRDQSLWNLNYLESMPDQLEVNVSQGELVVAQAEYDAATLDWDRVKNGPDTRQVSLAQARLKSTQTQLEAAHKDLDALELKAPFAGTISRLSIHKQEWTIPGQPILVLADLSRLRVETTDLNEIDAAQIRLNDLVNVTFDALPDVKIIGKVARIGTQASQGAGVNYPVLIELAEAPSKLRWGMTAFVDIQIKK